MNVTGMMSITRLRERAEQCRALVRQTRSDEIASELEKLACDYEKDADRLEILGPETMQAFFH